MRVKVYLIFIIAFFVSATSSGQSKKTYSDSLGFNLGYWTAIADKKGLNASEKSEYISFQKQLYFQGVSSYSQAPSPPAPQLNGKGFSQNLIMAGGCNNIDFELGTTSGWTLSSGFHPASTVVPMCCPTPGAQNLIMTGAGVDPFGGFPVVFPGGTASLRLGNSGTGAQADRARQTFFVTPANANFTYRYAVVLQDPGHNLLDQPAFVIDMIDTLGNPIPCTAYSVAAGNNIPGFFNSPTNGVVYKPWTSVSMDLTPVLGQNVTLRFTTYDCSLGGHFGYAYVDGFCTNFATSISDTTCPGIPMNLCGPIGFGSYSWNGPGVVNNPGQCINTSAPGVYTCQTILVPGCPGPSFTHTVNLLPNPVLSFTASALNNCAFQYSFVSTSSISAGSISSYTWNFGDNSGTFLQSPVHTYSATGSYPAKFKAVTNRGCRDSVSQLITIYPFPNLAYSPPSNCINTVVQFTNTSTIAVGSISSYTWNLGNGALSNLINPTNTYTTNGTYNVTLSATSNQGCVSSLSSTLGIFPAPVMTFTANNLCFGNSTAFSTSVTIPSGSVISYAWNFGDAATSTASTPVHTYSASGNYVASFSATSNHNCVASQTNTITIHPLPALLFSVTSVCLNNTTNFSNASTISLGTISTYTWNFGDGSANSNNVNPSHSYTTQGNYTSTLSATSNQGCFASTTRTLSVFPLPNVSFSPPSSCASTNISFTNNTTVSSGSIASYFWSFGNGNTSTLTSPANTYTNSGTYNVTLTATSDRNCVTTQTSNLVIFPLPQVTLAINNLCLGNITAFTNTSIISSGSIAGYNWNFGDGFFSPTPSPIHTYASSGSYPVTFTATSNNNCITTQTSNITIYPLPVISFTANNACPSAVSNFTNNSSIPLGSISSYTWNFGDGSPVSNAINPAHAYTNTNIFTASLSATSNQGCSQTGIRTITIHPVPNVVFSPPAACPNVVIQFTNQTSIASGSISSYQWNFANGNTSNSVNPVNTYTSSGTFNVTLTATSDKTCVSTQTTNLLIHPQPQVAIAANNFCFGNSTAFTNTSLIFPGSVTGYNWSFGDGFFAVAPNPSHVYALSGNFPISFTATSNNNCRTTQTLNVTIHPLPVISFTANNACPLAPSNFTNNSSIPLGSISSYTWNFGDGSPVSNNINPSHSYSNTNNYAATLTAASNQGCLASGTRTIVIHPLPNISFSPPSSCANSLIQFTNQTSIASGSIASYQWDFANGNTSNATNPLQSFSLNATYVVSLTATSDKTCTAIAVSSLVIYPQPTVNFAYNNVCHGNSTAFTSTSTIVSGSVVSYSWSFGDGGSSPNPNPSHTYGTSNNFVTTFSAISNFGCIGVQTQTVTIHPLPVITFTANSVCLNNPTTFTESSTIAAGNIVSWSWKFADNNVSAFQNPVHTYASHGTYVTTLTAISNQSCPATGTAAIIVHPLPNIAFSPPSACEGSVTQFTNSSSVALGSIIGYSWDFGDGGSSSLTNPSHGYTQPLVYVVTLTATTNQGCVKTGTNNLSILPYPQGSITPINSSCINDLVFINPNISISSGFAPNYTLNFGDGASSIITTPLNLTVPHTYTAYNTYTVFLTVNSNSNCARTFSRTVLVYPKPFVNFVSNKFCYKDSTNFINTSTIPFGYTIADHEWFFGNGAATSTLVNPRHKYTAPGQYTVTLIEYSYPEPGLTCSLAATKGVTIHALPSPDFIHNNACPGSPVSFTNTTLSQGIIGLTWNFNGLGASGALNPNFTFPGPGTYTTSLVALNNFGCKDTITKSVTTFSAPVSSYTSSYACLGAPISFTNQSTPGSGLSLSYSWNTGNVNFSTVKDPSYTFTAAGVYSVELVSTSNLGCSHKYISTVTVQPLPNVNFIPNEACLGKPSLFNNISGAINPVTSWCWDYNNDNICDDTSMTPAPKIFPNSGSFTIKLTARDVYQCASSKIVNVIVHANPLAGFAHKPLFCTGDNILFTNLSSSPDGSITVYQWDFNGDNIIDNYLKDPSNTYTLNGHYLIKLDIMTQYGCTDVKSKLIYANPKAVPVIASDKKEGCPELCVNFKNLSFISTGSIVSTQWDFGDGSPVSNISDAYHCYGSGIYDLGIKLTTDSGCVTTFVENSFITVFKRPVAAFKVEPEEVDEEEPLITVKSTAEDANFTRYFISDGTNYSTTNFNHSIKNLDKKIKPVIVQIVKSKNGCSDTLFRVLDIKPAFVIYFPNVFTPNADGTNDFFQAKGVGIINYAMQIYDRWGHKVFDCTDIHNAWDGRTDNSEQPIKQDVYTWKAQVIDIFNKTHAFVGHVSLIK